MKMILMKWWKWNDDQVLMCIDIIIISDSNQVLMILKWRNDNDISNVCGVLLTMILLGNNVCNNGKW